MSHETMAEQRQAASLGGFLDASSEIGQLYQLYLSHAHKQMLEARSKEVKGPLLPIVDPNIVCEKELVRAGMATYLPYANAGTTPEAIDAIRRENQKSSILLKLPTEVLIMIWKSAFRSTQTKRVHGAVSRLTSGHGLLSLAHTCSLLHSVLYPVFLGQDAFVVKVSSSEPTVAAKELIQWWRKVSSILPLTEPIKPLILLTHQVRWLPFEDAVKFAAKVQNLCSSAPLFRPKVLVETNEWLCYYCGPGTLMRLRAPPLGDSPEEEKLGNLFNASDPPPRCHNDTWKGWVAAPVTKDGFVYPKEPSSGALTWHRSWSAKQKEMEMLATCSKYGNLSSY